MKHGNNFKIIYIFLALFSSNILSAEEKILSTPLINLDRIQPSFEVSDGENDSVSTKNQIKEKKNEKINSHAVLIGLDKITAKSSKIQVNLDEIKKFGPLEIKILKCGKVKVHNQVNDVAYMQVKDLTKNENEKVYIFNGWTFSSDPNLTPFDHAIYDLQLVKCNNV